MHVGSALRLLVDNTTHELLLMQLLRDLNAQFGNWGPLVHRLLFIHKICRRLKLLGRFETMVAGVAHAGYFLLVGPCDRGYFRAGSWHHGEAGALGIPRARGLGKHRARLWSRMSLCVDRNLAV